MTAPQKKFAWLVGIFVAAYCLPLGNPKVTNAIFEAFNLLQWYARQHVLGCVVPAMFIAGAIATFLSHASVMQYLGPRANRPLAYGVASVSGCVLAVCSCSVLPMFAARVVANVRVLCRDVVVSGSVVPRATRRRGHRSGEDAAGS
jgi:uncharacterized membrane protein YraQ (UPF0718 family)